LALKHHGGDAYLFLFFLNNLLDNEWLPLYKQTTHGMTKNVHEIRREKDVQKV
jgi:hypothetical protein